MSEIIASDNGTQFTFEMFSTFCLENGIKNMFSHPYHPMFIGQAERFGLVISKEFS